MIRETISDLRDFIRAVPDHPLFLWIVFAVMVIAALSPR